MGRVRGLLRGLDKQKHYSYRGVLMEWNKKEKYIQSLENWIDSTYDEIDFAEKLIAFIEDSMSENDFIERAHKEAERYHNTCIKDELYSIIYSIVLPNSSN